MGERQHKITDWKKKQALELRNEHNMTYAEIADTMGISKARVGQLLYDASSKNNFHIWNEDRCPFPKLVSWLNRERMTMVKFAEHLGYAPNPSSYQNMRIRLREGRLSKREIDVILNMTGMTYEELFMAQ
jgi:transcriptional regulator with XRE-family HTH domain